MIKKIAALCLLAATMVGTALAQKRGNPKGIPHHDHIFVIMMENHGFQQIINNPNEPYLNSLIANGKVNLATNYFAVGHPSLTNYLEIVGGSNFGVRSDSSPDWGNTSCTPNIETNGVFNSDSVPPPGVLPAGVSAEQGPVCPISGSGTDTETPAVDTWNETTPPVFNFLADINGLTAVPAAPTVGMTIADQLERAGGGWKTYQESLPLGPTFGVNTSNGTVSNLTNFATLSTLTSYVQAYAVKHNPFAYFANVQEGMQNSGNGRSSHISGFGGAGGLYADLASGNVQAFSYIVPNQCDDQHGRSKSELSGSSDGYCGSDPGVSADNGNTAGTQAGLNPGLIQQGDVTIQRVVEAIEASPAWQEGRNAIVIVWDENDYSGLPNNTQGVFQLQNQNNVVLTVELNRDDERGVKSNTPYTSFSLLKSIEVAFGLPCLNHACDANVAVMSDLFGDR